MEGPGGLEASTCLAGTRKRAIRTPILPTFEQVGAETPSLRALADVWCLAGTRKHRYLGS